MLLRFFLLSCILSCRVTANAQSFDQALQPFLAKYCNDCHADGSNEGGFELDALTNDLSDAATFASWERLFDRVQTGEMPPADAEGVPDLQRAKFVTVLGRPLFKAHANFKGAVYRRLNRREYQNTLNDIFGTELNLESMLPEDGRSHEFDNVGESLSISMVQMRRYIEAIDLVLNTAIAKAVTAPEPKSITAKYSETSEGEKHIGTAWKQAEDGAVVFFRELGYPTGMLRTANARETGRYKIRVTGYAYQSDDPVTFAIGATTFQRGADKPTFAYRSFPPGKPTVIEIEARMEHRYMVDIKPWGISDDNYEIKKNGIDNYNGPGLAINQVELIGPIVDDFPSRGHKLLFEGLDRTEIEPNNPAQKTKSWYVPQFELGNSDAKAIESTLIRVATKAFRRPANTGDIQPYMGLYRDQKDAGDDIETALRTAVAAIFCSPEFLYLQEPEGWLSDDAIASRLSYFLARTRPDDFLLEAAKSGELRKDPQSLLHHTRRLLDHPHHQRFVTDFTDAWLNLRDIEFTAPDKDLFPEFDAYLQFSMIEETRKFFATMVADNLPVHNFIDSNFAMLNNRLAAHYAIEQVDGPEVRRVTLPDNSVRGGLLGQASILKVSANGTNTSPVVRGVWVLERLIGTTPPPPPAGISGVEPDIQGASTLRELLAKHRNVDSCRSCHEMIDPPGFALESFDPIGGWRDRFRVTGTGDKVNKTINGRKVRYKLGAEVDPSGQFADGKKFSGYREFRRLLADDEDQIAKTVATKLMTFATGREMGFSDRREIDRIVQQSKGQGHGLKDLIELVVTSEAFRRK